jgi:hypothetical protein
MKESKQGVKAEKVSQGKENKADEQRKWKEKGLVVLLMLPSFWLH